MAALETMRIPVTKAAGQFVDVELSKIPVEMYTAAVLQGLTILLNTRMSKVGSVTKLEGEALSKAQAEAVRIAKENYERLLNGTLKKGTRTKSVAQEGVPREVMTEARRLAMVDVNNKIRAAGKRPALVAAKLKTQLANELLVGDPSYIEKARFNLEESATKPVKIDITDRIVLSEDLVAKAKAKAKPRASGQHSAKQAGMPKVPPARPQAASQVTAH